jgi:copper chaperone CopZ
MTCDGCAAKVKSSLLLLPAVTSADVSRETDTVTITMDSHIPLSALQDALGGEKAKYRISPMHHSEAAEQAKGWLGTYKPVLLLLLFITLVSIAASSRPGPFSPMLFMNYFMGGFFLSFSYFKLINLKAFAESYAMYDVVAKRFPGWGYIYAFTEAALGLAYITGFHPLLTNVVTLAVMCISIIGVLQSVLNKRKIQCACLGAVFNLPMSTVTVIEDGSMIVMSGAMIAMLV